MFSTGNRDWNNIDTILQFVVFCYCWINKWELVVVAARPQRSNDTGFEKDETFQTQVFQPFQNQTHVLKRSLIVKFSSFLISKVQSNENTFKDVCMRSFLPMIYPELVFLPVGKSLYVTFSSPFLCFAIRCEIALFASLALCFQF